MNNSLSLTRTLSESLESLAESIAETHEEILIEDLDLAEQAILINSLRGEIARIESALNYLSERECR